MSIYQAHCTTCGEKTPVSGTECPVCADPIGFPNVRNASSEAGMLQDRYESARASIMLREIGQQADEFEQAVSTTNAVMARRFLEIVPMLSNDNLLIPTFFQQVASNARLAEDNKYDNNREAFEAKIHPYYADKVHYAALSLDATGVGGGYYGNCHIKFRTPLIEKRSSTFEENIWSFLVKHKITTEMEVPQGFRSTWGDRGKIAVCKLQSKLNKGTKEADYQGLLISGVGEKSEYIEVHIYGTLHLKSFDSITLVGNLTGAEEAILKSYQKKLDAAKIRVTRQK